MIAPGVLVLALAHAILAKVSPNFEGCEGYFYNGVLPEGFIGDLAPICQMYENGITYFATLYDRTHRFGLYSAYILDIPPNTNAGERDDITFKVEPQLVNKEFIEHYLLDQYTLDSFIPPLMMQQIQTQGAINNLRNFLPNLPQIPPDNYITNSQAINSDYERSGYHKGHLNPRAHHPEGLGQDATFTLTNVAPMNGHLNTVVWARIEMILREISATCGSMYVITGVVPGNNWIKERVNIPSDVWSAYCCLDNNYKPIRAGGFWAQNEYTDDYYVEDDIIAFQKYLGGAMNTTITLFDSNCRKIGQ